MQIREVFVQVESNKVSLNLLKILLLASLFFFTACKQTVENEDISSTQTTIKFAVAQMPINLDPRYATDAASERINRLIYQQLVDFDVASKPVPGLASWEMQSPIEFIFTLKTNRADISKSRFHHGKHLTANDVKATYDSILNLKDSPHTAEFSDIKNIEIKDENTLIFNLKNPNPDFPEKLIIGILPHDLIETRHDFAHQPVGSGPLKFVEWSRKLTLERIADLQKITLLEVKDPMVRVLKLQHGEADFLQGDLSPELLQYLSEQKNIQVNTHEGANFSYLGLNLQDPVLKHKKVRQALAYAIDRQAIIEKIMVDKTRLAGAILPPEHYAGNANLNPYLYQPQLAKKLLIEAGVKLPLKLEYKTSTDAQRVRIATILQAQMAQAGIEVSIKSLDWGTFFEDVKQGKFQLYGLTWVGIKTPEIYAKAFKSDAVPPNGFNRGRFENSALDILIAERNWQAATALIHTELPYIPLWYEGQFIAAQKNMQFLPPATDGNWDFLATIKNVKNP